MRQKTSFPIRYGGVLLRTETSETPLPEFLRTGTSETLFLEFLQTAPENLVPYKAQWSIAAYGNLRNSISGVSAHRVRQKTSFHTRGAVCFCYESFNNYN